jgi:hypothetical protein
MSTSFLFRAGVYLVVIIGAVAWYGSYCRDAERQAAEVASENVRLMDYAAAHKEAAKSSARAAMRMKIDLMKAEAEYDMIGKPDLEKKMIRLRYEKAVMDLLNAPITTP